MSVFLKRRSPSRCASHVKRWANIVTLCGRSILTIDGHSSWTMNVHILWKGIFLIHIICVCSVDCLRLTRFAEPCPFITRTLCRSCCCSCRTKIIFVYYAIQSVCLIVSGQVVSCVCAPRTHTSTQISRRHKILLYSIRGLNEGVFSTAWCKLGYSSSWTWWWGCTGVATRAWSWAYLFCLVDNILGRISLGSLIGAWYTSWAIVSCSTICACICAWIYPLTSLAGGKHSATC